MAFVCHHVDHTGGVVSALVLRRARLVDNPMGFTNPTTRAFHNPVFGQDNAAARQQKSPTRPSISTPMEFRHVASGSTGGFLSDPSEFRHVSSGTSGLISSPSDFRHVAHGGPDTPVTVRTMPLSEAARLRTEQRGNPGGVAVGKPKVIKRIDAKARERPTYVGAHASEDPEVFGF